MPIYHIIIAEKIKEYRRENKLTQYEFGRLLGVSAQAVSKWEKNICCPDIIFLPRLAWILNCKTDDFFESSIIQKE
jgi:DNA-binding XRE family transcriptional regulator